MEETPETNGPQLTGAQKKYLKGLGHHLTPLVYIGREGIADSVVEAIDAALLAHELVKVKIVNTASVTKHEAAAILPAKTASILVQLIGKTLLLYRRNLKRKKDEQIRLPGR